MNNLKQKLRRFRNLEELSNLATRLFQKDPQISTELQLLLKNFTNQRDAASELRHFILTTIERAIEKKSRILPTRLENYIAFSDLSYVVHHSHEKVWHAIYLQDFPENIHDEDEREDFLSVYRLRKSVKENLCQKVSNVAASVQFEYRLTEEPGADGSNCDEIIFFRICSVPNLKGKNPEKVESRLCAKRPSFIAYFPGEPYLYVDSSAVDETHVQALVDTLRCSGYIHIPLSGRHVESLRKMRIIRDKMKQGDQCTSESMPKLETLSLHIKPDNLTLEFRGSNIYEGLADFKEAKVFPELTPSWVKLASRRGRNSITVVTKKSSRQENNNEDDALSVAATDITCLR